MYINLASSFTYISVLVQFVFIFPLQLIRASIYALPFKLLGLGTVTQLCLWLLYTRIILQTLLNTCVNLQLCGMYNKHLPTRLPKTKISVLHTSILYESIQGYKYKKLSVRHCTMILMEILYTTALHTHTHTHTPKLWFGPWVRFIPCLASCFVFHTVPIKVQEIIQHLLLVH
jgi:hypothetical protein